MASSFLSINPQNQIEFQFTPNRQSQTSLTLKNIADKNVAFKIKTTAPRSYLVRPNTGIIFPGEQLEVSVTLNPLQEIPQDPNHKFQILAAKTNLVKDQIEEVNQIWNTLDKSQQQQERIKVSFRKVEDNTRFLSSRVESSQIQSTVGNCVEARKSFGNQEDHPKSQKDQNPQLVSFNTVLKRSFNKYCQKRDRVLTKIARSGKNRKE